MRIEATFPSDSVETSGAVLVPGPEDAVRAGAARPRREVAVETERSRPAQVKLAGSCRRAGRPLPVDRLPLDVEEGRGVDRQVQRLVRQFAPEESRGLR
jgi:hypothetical protein